MTIPQFVFDAKYYWSSKLFSVGMKLLERLEGLLKFYSRNYISLFCQGLVDLRIFEVSKFLMESELPYLKYHSRKQQKTQAQDKLNEGKPTEIHRVKGEELPGLKLRSPGPESTTTPSRAGTEQLLILHIAC